MVKHCFHLFRNLLLAALCAISASAQPAKPAADLLITNAKVWTVDKTRPRAESVAVLRDRIVAVGSNEEVAIWRGPGTRVIDAGGRRVLPGFNDAHVHFVSGGQQLDAVELNDASSAKEFAHRIAERAKNTSPGG